MNKRNILLSLTILSTWIGLVITIIAIFTGIDNTCAILRYIVAILMIPGTVYIFCAFIEALKREFNRNFERKK